MNAVDAVTVARVATLEVDGLRFRDLDHDGVLAPYEDRRRPITERVDDLLVRLTLEEKVGLMLHGILRADDGPLAMLGVGRAYDMDAAPSQVLDRGVSSLITRLATDPMVLAVQNNLIQDVAAGGRLGIR